MTKVKIKEKEEIGFYHPYPLKTAFVQNLWICKVLLKFSLFHIANSTKYQKRKTYIVFQDQINYRCIIASPFVYLVLRRTSCWYNYEVLKRKKMVFRTKC